MRTIIAGSQSVSAYQVTLEAIEKSGFDITVVLCGEANGPDEHGKQYAIDNDKYIESYPADWTMFDKKAGMVRNIEMGNRAEALIAVGDGKSPGTKHMIKTANERCLEVFVFHAEPCN